MKKLAFFFLALTLVIAAIILLYNRTERSPAGATLVPENTLLFVDAPDFQACREQLAGTPLAALWAEPEVQRFLDKPLAALREAIGRPKNSEDEARWQQVLALPQGEVFVAITRFVATPKVDFSAVVGVDVKMHKPQAFAYLKYHEYQVAKNYPSAKIEKKTYLGVDYSMGRVSSVPHACYGFLGTVLVATTDEEQMRDVITRFTGNMPPDALALDASPRYQNALHRLPENHASWAFVNVEQLLGQYGMLLLMASQGSPALESIGNIQATTAAVSFDATGVTDSTLITYGKDHQPDAPIQRRTLAVAPGDSTFYAVQQTDLAAGFTKLMQALALSHNNDAMKLAGNLDKFLTDAGVHLSDDFLAHLGPEVAYLGNWREGALTPDMALVVEVKNRAAIGDKFETIVKTVTKTVERTDELTQAGETLHIIRTGSSHASPTYVLTDKYFILASTPDYAKEIITQTKSGTTSLADSADFKTAVQRVPTGGSSFSYCDLRKVIGGLWALGRANATNSTSWIAWNDLPQADTITRHLGSYVSTTVENDKASTTTTYSPIGKPAALVVALTGGIAAAQPWLAQLPASFMQGLPTMSSSTAAPPPPPGNQTAASRTPMP